MARFLETLYVAGQTVLAGKSLVYGRESYLCMPKGNGLLAYLQCSAWEGIFGSLVGLIVAYF